MCKGQLFNTALSNKKYSALGKMHFLQAPPLENTLVSISGKNNCCKSIVLTLSLLISCEGVNQSARQKKIDASCQPGIGVVDKLSANVTAQRVFRMVSRITKQQTKFQ